MPVSVGVYSTGCTCLCQWEFRVQAVHACVSGSLGTGYTCLCQWEFTVLAVHACVSGCLQYRLYKPVRPYVVASNFGVVKE